MSKDEKKEEDPKDDAGIMESNFDESVETFDELNLKPDLLRGIYGYGFVNQIYLEVSMVTVSKNLPLSNKKPFFPLLKEMM